MKTCATCGETKPVGAFFPRSRTDPTPRGSCRTCVNAANSQWRKDNRVVCRTYTARHRAKYPLRTQLRASSRYAKTYGVANTLIEAEWVAVLEEYGYRCAYCLGSGSIIEHVVPMMSGGSNSKENVVPGCQACNIAKASNVRALIPHVGSRFWPPSEAMLSV